jgi:hypothetical protein
MPQPRKGDLEVKKLIATIVLASVPLFASAAESGVRFDTVISENGKAIANPSVWVPFGQDAVIEVPKKVRVVAKASAPIAGDQSKVTARMYYFAHGSWVLDVDASMEAHIGQTPSFEKSLADKVHRVVVMPRAADQPSSAGI